MKVVPAEELAKVPPDLSMNQLYKRIYDWCRAHESRFPGSLSLLSKKQCLELVHELPPPDEADENDALFLAYEVLAGYMSWSYDEKDEHGIKMAAYAHNIAQRVPGGIQNLLGKAAKSKLARKYHPIIRATRRVLQSLETDKLRTFYNSQVSMPKLSEKAPRAFIIDKIIEKSDPENLLDDKTLVIALAEKFDQISSTVETILSDLDLESVTKICKELGVVETESPRSKADIVRKLISEVPLSKIWESKAFTQKLRPRAVPASDLKRIKTGLSTMHKMLGDFNKKQSETIRDLFEENRGEIRKVLWEIQETKKNLGLDQFADLEEYLKAFYEQALTTTGSLSADHLKKADQEVLHKLGMARLPFLMEGLELLLLHYFMTNIKSLQWKPSLESFMTIVRQEFAKIKGVGEQAEIPALRERVCLSMGISEETFDDMLTQAWEKKLVDLDIGRPIGQANVKYLITRAGSMFFYVKLKG